MEGALDHLQLLLAAQAVEVHGVAGHADGQRRILFRVLHSVQQNLAVHHVHVQMVRALDEIAVQDLYQIAAAFFGGFAQCVGTMEKVLETPSWHTAR